MLILCVMLVLFIVLRLSLGRSNVPAVRRCYSVSCGHNRGGKCQRKEIDIIDNGGLGICLWHTVGALQRFQPLFEKVEKLAHTITPEIAERLKKDLKKTQEELALTNDKEWEAWLLRHGVKS